MPSLFLEIGPNIFMASARSSSHSGHVYRGVNDANLRELGRAASLSLLILQHTGISRVCL